MKHHLNTLYVTTQGTYLAKERETVVVRLEGETKLRLPLLTLDGIVCFGNVSVSPFLLGLCGRKGVNVSLLSSNGRFLARVVGETSGNVLLRREQYRRADDLPRAAEIARSILRAKVLNGRHVLMRSLRDSPAEDEGDSRAAAVKTLALLGGQLEKADDLDTLRGIEGAAGRAYFESFDSLIVQQRESFRFEGRSRRPPTDPVNSLLSFLYTLVRHDVTGALEGVGLDPQVGFLHRDRPGRAGLALDLMEELRAPIADRLALTLINRQQVRPEGFTTGESGGVVMDDETRKTVLVAYQERKQVEVKHPFLGEKTTLGLLFHLQA
ncbi:MAG TPA: type I-C CRISPR-associated endonuclease Cas1c, partial [Thermoanaerobaculia bacterium]|nr:type I-C CRISPR-associated endonuclease Cas1c [Thermoanaerobaculia bacterium]